MLRNGARRLHTWLAWLFVVAVVIQVFLAGFAMFGATGGFGLHIEFGYTVIGLLALGAIIARRGSAAGRGGGNA